MLHYFLHVDVLSYLSIATIYASFVAGVVPVKIMNFEEYPTIANRGTVRKFITVQVNCTKFVDYLQPQLQCLQRIYV